MKILKGLVFGIGSEKQSGPRFGLIFLLGFVIFFIIFGRGMMMNQFRQGAGRPHVKHDLPDPDPKKGGEVSRFRPNDSSVDSTTLDPSLYTRPAGK
jgi:hypothetical protein